MKWLNSQAAPKTRLAQTAMISSCFNILWL